MNNVFACNYNFQNLLYPDILDMINAQSAGDIEYTACIAAEW